MALRIPKALADGARIVSGTEVDVALEEGRLVVTALAPGMALAELLALVTDENRHGEVQSVPTVGREAW